MTMRQFTIAITALAALAACQKEAPPPSEPQKQIRVRSEGQKQLFAAKDFNRAIALKRAIIDSDSSCRRVETTGFVGTFKNMDYWTASCVDQYKRTRDWAIFVGADDSVQARLCTDTAKAGLPPCTAKAGTEGGTGMVTKKRAG